jgi:hypothetical protein
MAKTMGMTDVTSFIVGTASSIRDDTVDLQADKFRRDLGDAVEASLQPAIFDCDAATLDPAEFAQSLHKGSRPWPPDRSVRAQEPNGRQLAWLLRPRRERPSNGSAARECDEFAPPHGLPFRPRIIPYHIVVGMPRCASHENLAADGRDGSFASKAAEAVRPCTSATPQKLT